MNCSDQRLCMAVNSNRRFYSSVCGSNNIRGYNRKESRPESSIWYGLSAESSSLIFCSEKTDYRPATPGSQKTAGTPNSQVDWWSIPSSQKSPATKKLELEMNGDTGCTIPPHYFDVALHFLLIINLIVQLPQLLNRRRKLKNQKRAKILPKRSGKSARLILKTKNRNPRRPNANQGRRRKMAQRNEKLRRTAKRRSSQRKVREK